MSTETHTSRNGRANDLWKFIWNSVNKSWAVAGGMGGLGGVALVLVIQSVFDLNPLLGVSATIGVVFTLLAIGFKRQLDRLFRDYDQAIERITHLQRRLSNVPQVVDQGILEINEMLLHLAAISDEFKSFVGQAESAIISELPKILPIRRVGWYIPDPNAKSQDTENPSPLSFKYQDSPGFKSDKNTIRADLSLCLEMLKGQQPSVPIEKMSRAFISITDRDDPHRIWGVLFIYSQELERVEKQIREKIVPKLQQGFRLVWDRQNNLEERIKCSEIKPRHVCGVLLPDLQLDPEFTLGKDDKTYLQQIVKDNTLEIERAFAAEEGITIHRESYCVSLIPLDERERRREVLISVDAIEGRKLAEDRSRWSSMRDLVRYIARSRIGEQTLATKRYFNKHLTRMVSDTATVQKIALIAILLDDLHRFAQTPLQRSQAKEVVENALEHWKNSFDPRLTEATAYDDQTFLMCMSTESPGTTMALAKTIKDHLRTELSRELVLNRPPRIFVGVAYSPRQLQDCNDLVMAALSALEDSRTAGHEVGMKTVGTETPR